MDPIELERLLATFLADDAPPTVVSEGEALFELRAHADELAERVEDDGPVDPRSASETSIRVLVFASDTAVVAVAVDDDSRYAVGQLVPARSASIRLVSVASPAYSALADAAGVFELPEVPSGYIQLLIEPGRGDLGPALKTAWSELVDSSVDEQRPPGSFDRLADDLLRRRLAARASAAADRHGLTRMRRKVDLDVVPTGMLDPPVASVDRVLAPAAQQGAWPLPRHRWVSDDERLDVTLEETPDGRLTVTVTSSADLDAGVVVSAAWSTTSLEGRVSEEHIATPLPVEVSERRIATYDVGSALDVRSFGLGEVRLLATEAVTPAVVAATVGHRPYGNAVRAWEELTTRIGDARLCRVPERALDVM